MEKYIGIIEVGESVLSIIERDGKLIAGTTCNSGMMEQYEQEIDPVFSLDENLQSFLEEIEEKEGQELYWKDN